METEKGVSVIPCKVNGLNLKFVFDTGASDVSLSLIEATFMLKNGYLDQSDIMGTAKYSDANGDINEGVVINLKEVEIAGLKLYDVKATIIKNTKAPLLLGQSAISKLGKIQIDLTSNTITILKGQKESENSKPDTTSVIKLDPLAVITSQISEENYEAVIMYCDSFLLDSPRNEELYVYRAFAKGELGSHVEAILDYNKAIAINSTYSKAYCFRGISNAKLKKNQSALADFNKSIALDPKYDYAFSARGDLKILLKNFQGAIVDYSKAIQLDPGEPGYYLNRGYVKGEVKDYLGAVADYNKAIQLGSEDFTAYLNRANMKVELKNYRSALDDYNKAIDLNPQSATTYYARGMAKEKVKDLEGALNDYNKALDFDPSFYMASIRAAFIKQEIKDNDWIYVLAQDGEKWFIKSEYVFKEGTNIKIWIKEEMKNKTLVINNKRLNFSNVKMLTLVEFECTNKQAKFYSTIYYDSKGNVLQRSTQDKDWRDIAPAAILSAMLNITCEQFN